jgi:hypothetical protein
LHYFVFLTTAFATAALAVAAGAQTSTAPAAPSQSISEMRAAIAREKVPPLVVPAGIDPDAYCLVAVQDYLLRFEKMPDAERGQWANQQQHLTSASAFYMGVVEARRDDAELAKILPPAVRAYFKASLDERKNAFATCLQQVTSRRLRVVDQMSDKK